MEANHEELRLLKEALWYANWSVVFGVVGIIVSAVMFVEILKDRFDAFVTLWAVAIATWLFGKYLHGKSRQYRQKADEVRR